MVDYILDRGQAANVNVAVIYSPWKLEDLERV
jgi:hypothetical protein